MKKVKNVLLSLPESDYKKIKNEAGRRYMTFSALIREIIAKYLEVKKNG